MLKEEIKKIYDERIIKWITLEAEVMTEVQNHFSAGEITEAEWNEYFVDLVKTHGTAMMLKQIKSYLKFQESIEELLM